MGLRVFLLKMAAASAAVLSSSVAVRLATPAVADFLAAKAPRLYDSVSAWLTPPYLYFVINGIIISIAATSRFQKPIPDSDHLALDSSLPVLPATIPSYANTAAAEYISNVADGVNLQPDFMELPVAAVETDREEFVISRSSWSPRRRESSDDLQEKAPSTGVGEAATEEPLVSSRPCRRRSIKSSPEGYKALGVSRPKKKHDTLESTWRTITDGRPVPLARHLKKYDTLETHMGVTTADPVQPFPAMFKSNTFAAQPVATDGQSPPSSRSGASSPSSGKLRRELSASKLRREPSLGQDDLNRRVEAFIKKFNEEMRLQRQNSLQQYMDMISRSSH